MHVSVGSVTSSKLLTYHRGFKFSQLEMST